MKSVGVVCSTYRNPDRISLVRLYGVVSLLDQMNHQNYDGPIKLALVDDSPTPHPFYEKIAEKFPDSVVYVHAPDRESMAAKLKETGHPGAASFIPTNRILQEAARQDIEARLKAGEPVYAPELRLANGNFNLTPVEWDQVVGKVPVEPVSEARALFQAIGPAANLAEAEQEQVAYWRERLEQMRAFAHFVPFERDYPIQTNIYSQIFQDRPTIGMKKNVGVQALAEKFGEYDVIVFADDDDHHGPDYVAKVVEALGDNDFTRMTRYYTHIFTSEPEKRREGIFDLKIQKDKAGYWVQLAQEAAVGMKMWHPDGYAMEKPIGDKFSRPVAMAWPIISHEGALHAYSFPAWKRSVDAFGGAAPVSFCEDIIYYRMNKDHFGFSFKDVLTPVMPGDESFIRMADGRNASVIEWMEDLQPGSTPEWTHEALKLLYAAEKLDDAQHDFALRRLAESYADTGEIDYRIMEAMRPRSPGSDQAPSVPAP